ncbi:nondiscriminating glutamyl-tRNA synthetase EARS2, mitochondrial [Lepeophtheirus salmonis]|uniref:nondiscriminating glutamyl-tRNA synthetase EARS2, mitochondrial n=1 Tax=Lepeophtheirus salmonis TaxID=72036 RepID=UPI001AEA0971|nr:probable glutamate--tRNA ligase, mitochondrial [Lepeophtheirus salmonis]
MRILFPHYIFRSMSTRVRFAPSPTGSLHLGGLRTAFYNYLFAKKEKGAFILRLEDTDQQRFVPGASKEIEQMLEWSGLSPDESPTKGGQFGPYEQSQRTHIYKQYSEKLLESGSAYRCFCSGKRLALMKKDANRSKRPNKYDRRCLHLSQQEIQDKLGQGVPFTIRFKLRPFKEGYNDLIYGHTNHDVYEFEGDPIIMKSDGFPTYHFANVIDDHLMKITHVFRGVEWQVSTPKHIMLYEAFEWKPPIYAHLPLIVNSDGSKLSKRQKDIDVKYYKDNGYFSDAILNFLSTVGGGFDYRDHSCEKVYLLSDLLHKFNPTRISTVSSRIEKEKLNTLNRFFIKSKFDNDPNELFTSIKTLYPELETMKEEHFVKLMEWSWNRINTLYDLSLTKSVSFAWFPPKYICHLDSKELQILKDVKNIIMIETVDFSSRLKTLAKNNNMKYSEVMKFIRKVLCGETQGPPIKEMVDVVGLNMILDQIDRTISFNTSK